MSRPHPFIRTSKFGKFGIPTPLALAVGLALTLTFTSSPALAGWVCDGDGVGNPLLSTATGGFACGFRNAASGVSSNALGIFNTASGDGSSAVGYGNTASGVSSSAFGNLGVVGVGAIGAIAIGGNSGVAGSGAAGSGANIAGGASSAVAIGASVNVGGNAVDSVAIGTGATVNANVTGAVALGQGAVAAQSNTVSVGNVGFEKRVVNVATATGGTDAVNFSQLQAVMSQLIQSGLCTVSGASVRCGTATSANAIQIGSSATVNAGANDAIALGSSANARSANGIAIGRAATAVSSSSIAIGAGAFAQSSVAVGVGAQATGINTTAVGDNALASGNFAVALGNNATAIHLNSVALGNSSVTSSANSVSVGAVGAERTIQNVAPGVLPTDAVNVSQLNSVLGGSLNGIQGQINTLTGRVDEVEKLASRGTAIALAAVPPPALAAGESGVAVGVGQFNGATAIGASFGHAITDNLMLSVGAASSGGKTGTRAGLSFKF